MKNIYKNIQTPSFLTTFDSEKGIELFEPHQIFLLKMLAKVMNVFILKVLSTRCFHQWGGAKMMLREIHGFMQPGDFVYKTDVYSYYASMNHALLYHQLEAIDWPRRLMATVMAYCERIILRNGPSLFCKSGIPKGGSLSPVLGALYLTPLDHRMERWMARGDCFYARFQDDIILIARRRHILRQMRKDMYKILEGLRLGLRPEKTFVGRSEKGFDMLGYHITLECFSPSRKTQEKTLEKALQRYAQGGEESLHLYLKRWKSWVHSGLQNKVVDINKILTNIIR